MHLCSWPHCIRRTMNSFMMMMTMSTFPGVLSDFQHRLSGTCCRKQFSSVTLVCFFFLNLDLKLFYSLRNFTEHWSDLPPAPLKLRAYGTIEIRLLLLLCPRPHRRSIKQWCCLTSDWRLSCTSWIFMAHTATRSKARWVPQPRLRHVWAGAGPQLAARTGAGHIMAASHPQFVIIIIIIINSVLVNNIVRP